MSYNLRNTRNSLRVTYIEEYRRTSLTNEKNRSCLFWSMLKKILETQEKKKKGKLVIPIMVQPLQISDIVVL